MSVEAISRTTIPQNDTTTIRTALPVFVAKCHAAWEGVKAALAKAWSFLQTPPGLGLAFLSLSVALFTIAYINAKELNEYVRIALIVATVAAFGIGGTIFEWISVQRDVHEYGICALDAGRESAHRRWLYTHQPSDIIYGGSIMGACMLALYEIVVYVTVES